MCDLSFFNIPTCAGLYIILLGILPCRGSGLLRLPPVFTHSGALHFMFFYLVQAGCTDAPPTWWDSATRLLSYLCWRYEHVHTHPSRSSRTQSNIFVHLRTCHCFELSSSSSQHVDKWSFDVFALNEASGDHALKFIFYELLTRYDLISRFKVKPQGRLRICLRIFGFVSLKRGETGTSQCRITFSVPLRRAWFDGSRHTRFSVWHMLDRAVSPNNDWITKREAHSALHLNRCSRSWFSTAPYSWGHFTLSDRTLT